MPTYLLPELPAGAHATDLVPTGAGGHELKPETTVLAINRSNRPLVDKFDGRDYPIPVGLFYTTYGAALHFQERLIVPGSRNLEVGGFESYIGIVGLDAPELCEPFTEEELAAFGEKVEGIDRSAFASAADRDVVVVKTAAARRTIAGQGLVERTKRPQTDISIQATDAATEAAQDILTPPEETDAQRETVEAQREVGWAPSAPRTMADVGRSVRRSPK